MKRNPIAKALRSPHLAPKKISSAKKPKRREKHLKDIRKAPNDEIGAFLLPLTC